MNTARDESMDEAAGLLDSAVDITRDLLELAPDGDLNRIAVRLEERGEVLNRLFVLRRTRPLTRRGSEATDEARNLQSGLDILRTLDAEFRKLLEQRKRGVLGKIREAHDQRNLESYSKQGSI